MKWFIAIKEHDISKAMQDATLFGVSQPVPILMDDESDTGYRILSTRDKYASPLAGYIKYDKDEILTVTADIKLGKKVNTRIKFPQKQSAFLDPEGSHARYQQLGIVNTAENECTWTATQDFFITGVKFHVIGSEIGDTVDFEVHHPLLGKIEGFADDWLIWDGTHNEDVYPAKVYAGLQIVIRLNKDTRIGSTTILVNGKLHEIP